MNGHKLSRLDENITDDELMPKHVDSDKMFSMAKRWKR
jgi:hypothetical protein